MSRYKIIFSYIGTSYLGYQIQKQGRTIQGEIQLILKKIYSKDIKLVASGRTDAGVHANEQVAHYNVNKNINIEIKDIPNMLNYYLKKQNNNSINIKTACLVNDNFHARYDAKVRHYRYRIVDDNIVNYNENVLLIKDRINVVEFEKYLSLFEGVHNFTSFCSVKDESKLKIREIFKVSVVRCKEHVMIDIYGNAFLMHMVRKIIGMSLYAYRDNLGIDYLKHLLQQQDGTLTKHLVSSSGLTLEKIYYTSIFGERDYYKKREV